MRVQGGSREPTKKSSALRTGWTSLASCLSGHDPNGLYSKANAGSLSSPAAMRNIKFQFDIS